eukprot:CAMPEP_0177581096 /NCGR_PEP_ID=MMETSP0419_2-20121207/1954_1 /TAXON_ID=582737 /ORGANISM="Tetraselmis sp., Strain GSL018" /LENGTH=32 /DNA_ID= /DNA_START= /DNA_END= /DNA_ORIENTATION=
MRDYGRRPLGYATIFSRGDKRVHELATTGFED